MRLSTGTLLFNGKYKVENVLGQGGFGITYLAVHISLDKQVVIKEFFIKTYSQRNDDNSVSAPGLGSGEYAKFKDKFLEEARLLAKFEENPYIVDVTDHFEENGTAYFVMPHIKGMSLTEFASKQPNGILKEEDSIKVIRQLALALAEMHQKGVLHRDIKPDNLIVTDKGALMLIDFGSAREYITQEFGERNTIMLTPGYAPPEQYNANAEKGVYTDIYAMGALMYRLLTGKLPLDAEKRKKETLTPPIQLNSNISAQTNANILKAMDMMPEFRFQSVTAFTNALLEKTIIKEVEKPLPPEEKTPPPPPKEEEKLIEKTPPPPKIEEKPVVNTILEKADELFQQKKYPLALAFYQEALKGEPQNPFILKQISLCKQEIKPANPPKTEEKKSVEKTENSFLQANWKYLALSVFVAGIILAGVKLAFVSEKVKPSYPEMVLVTGGTFWQGNKDKNAPEDEKPTHEVTLSTFYIGKTEVTNKEWTTFAKSEKLPLSKEMKTKGMENYPVINISRLDAEKYCQWLTKKLGKKYRLPTEAEWEYAAAGGGRNQNFIFSGSTVSSKVAWCGNSSIHPVKLKDPNQLNLYDMSGNVWEWCADSYNGNYYKECQKVAKNSTLRNPICARGGDLGVIRGGDYKTAEKECRISNRTALKIDRLSSQYVVGVRVVREL